MIHKFGPWVDATPYVHLLDAIDAIGSNTETLLISKTIDIGTEELLIPDNVSLRFLHGGSIYIDKTETLIVNGSIEAGLYRIIEGNGQVRFNRIPASSLLGSPRGNTPSWPPPVGSVMTHWGTPQLELYPEWWGVKLGVFDITQANDNDRAIRKLLRSLPDTGGVMVVSDELYISETLYFPVFMPTFQDTSEQELVDLANDIKNQYEAHRLDTMVHIVADTVHGVSGISTDLASAIKLLNALKHAYQAHRKNKNSHPVEDRNHEIIAADAYNFATANVLSRELREKYNAHRATIDQVHKKADANEVNTPWVHANPFLMNFTIRGHGGVRSQIIQLKEDWAVVMGGQRVAVTAYPAQNSWLALEELTISSQGSGVRLHLAGKRAYISKLTISRCLGQYGLLIDGDFSGGTIDRVYCTNNAHIGAGLQNTQIASFDQLIARNNGSSGVEIRDCSVVSGDIYTEQNSGYGLDIDGFRDSTIHIWTESNSKHLGSKGGLGKAQIKIRNSHTCRFIGRNGLLFGTIDADPLSRTTCAFIDDGTFREDTFRPNLSSDFIGVVTNPVEQYLFANNFAGPFNHGVLTQAANPLLEISQDNLIGYSDNHSLRIDVKENSFCIRHYIELFRWGVKANGQPLAQAKFDLGDYILLRYRAKTNEAGAAFYRAKHDDPLVSHLRPLYFVFNASKDNSVPELFLDTNWRTQQSLFRVERTDDPVRLFVYVGIGLESGPSKSEEHSIWIDDVEVYRIPKDTVIGSDEPISLGIPILINDQDNGYPQSGQVIAPGAYITAPQLTITSNLVKPLKLQGRKIFYDPGIPQEIVEAGSIAFDPTPTAGGNLGRVCVNSANTTTSNAKNLTAVTSVPVSSTNGTTVGDAMAIVITDMDPATAGRLKLHWSTVTGIAAGTSLTFADKTPVNWVIQPNAQVFTMQWKSFGSISM